MRGQHKTQVISSTQRGSCRRVLPSGLEAQIVFEPDIVAADIVPDLEDLAALELGYGSTKIEIELSADLRNLDRWALAQILVAHLENSIRIAGDDEVMDQITDRPGSCRKH